MLWVTGLKPKMYNKSLFSLIPRNLFTDKDPDVVHFLVHSDLEECHGFSSLHDFLCLPRFVFYPVQFPYILS